MRLKNGLAGWLSALVLSAALPLPFEAGAEPARWPCQGRCIDAAIIWNNGFAFFFKADKFWRYDIEYGKVDLGRDFGFPRPLREWRDLPTAWSVGIDAALNDGNGKAYLFKGKEYVRLDLVTERVDAGPLPITTNFPGLPQPWSSGFDAAVNWGNGKVYFFKGRDYLGYDLATHRATEPRPIASAWKGLPSPWANGIDAAVNWGDGTAYLFKGDQYVRYDIASDKVDSGYPQPITTGWPGLMPLVDWAPGPVARMPLLAMRVGSEADGRDIFVCAAMVGNAVYPGKTGATSRTCGYIDDEHEQAADVFAIATTALPIAWQPGSSPSLSSDKLIPIGWSSAGRAYYLCRAQSGGAVHPGRFSDRSEGCTIAQQGRPFTVHNNVEIALAPTIVNLPSMPYTAQMFSPIAGSVRFKRVCASEVVYRFRDAAAAARLPIDLPDMRSMIQAASRNSCATLYKGPAEVPPYAHKVEVVIETNKENNADGFVSRSGAVSTMTLQARMFPAPPPDTPRVLVTLINHEITHTTQGLNFKFGAFTEGMADYVLLKRWQRRDRQAGGDWLDGYANTAFFLTWLDGRYPEFVYKFNKLAARKQEVGPEAFRTLTGKSIDELWREYQGWLMTARTQPESRLQWSHGYSFERGRACALTVYWDDDFHGDSFRTTQDHLSLSGGWNDQISSIMIKSGVWEFFWDDSLAGKVLTLGAGQYARLGDMGWNDQISSFRCLDRDPSLHRWPSVGCELAAYWDDNFGGDSLHTTHDLMHLQGGWNDQISSIVVTAGTWELFEHDAFAGEVLRVGPGRYGRLNNWNDRISSLRCIEPTAARSGNQPPPADQRISIQSPSEAGGKCIDVPFGRYEDGIRLQMWDCNNGPAQTFAYDQPTQALKIGSLCVESWGRGDAQDAVGLGICRSTASQRWRVTENGAFYQIIGINNRCLELRSGVGDSGAPLDIQDCDASKPFRFWKVTGTAAASEPRSEAAKGACHLDEFTFSAVLSQSVSVKGESTEGTPCHHSFAPIHPDEVQFTSASITNRPMNGVIEQTGGFSFRYQPQLGYKGGDEYAFKVCGHNRHRSGCATITFHIVVK